MEIRASTHLAEQCAGGEQRPRPKNAGQYWHCPARTRARPAGRPVLLKSCNKHRLRTVDSKFLAQTSAWGRRTAPQRPPTLQAARYRSGPMSGAAASAQPGPLPAVGAGESAQPETSPPAPGGPWAREMGRRVSSGGREMRCRSCSTYRPSQAALGGAGGAASGASTSCAVRLRRPVELGLQRGRTRPRSRRGVRGGRGRATAGGLGQRERLLGAHSGPHGPLPRAAGPLALCPVIGPFWGAIGPSISTGRLHSEPVLLIRSLSA